MRPTYVLGEYAEWAAPTAVAAVIESSWTYAAARPLVDAPEPAVHRVLPHNGVSLVVRGRRDPAGFFRAAGIQVQGASEGFRFFEPCHETTLIAVRLRPEWVVPVLGTHPVDVKDRTVDMERTSNWRDVFARLHELRDPMAVLLSLEALVHDRLSEVRADSAGMAVHRALERVRIDPGAGKVAALARSSGVSERTLRRNVTSLTGMGPKWIQRVERLTRAVTVSDGIRCPDWSRVALRFGFSDHAHLAREARALTGSTPRALHRERRLQHRVHRATLVPAGRRIPGGPDDSVSATRLEEIGQPDR